MGLCLFVVFWWGWSLWAMGLTRASRVCVAGVGDLMYLLPCVRDRIPSTWAVCCLFSSVFMPALWSLQFCDVS